MTGPPRVKCWEALLLAVLTGLALLSPGCTSEADQSPAQGQTTTTLAAPASPPAAAVKPRPEAAPKPTAMDNDPAPLLEQAQRALSQGRERQALDQIDGAAQALWRRLPLALSLALLVAEPAKGYGIYQPRKDNVYLMASPERPVFPGKGQPMYIYLEPMGYGVKSLPGGRKQISFAMDVELFDGQGKQLFSKKDFMRTQTVSRHFNREFFLNVTVNLKGAPLGSYKLRLTLKDLVKKQEAAASLPVRLAMAPLDRK